MKSYSRTALSLPDQLLTERFRLRVPRESDIDCFWAMDSDPMVMKYVDTVASDRAAHAEEVRKGLDGDRFRFLLVIEARTAPTPMGWIFLRPTEDGEWLELGYRLLPRFWGRGIVPEASEAVIRHAVDVWQADRIMALIMPGNEKSRRVAEKLGCAMAGTTDRYYDCELELWVRGTD